VGHKAAPLRGLLGGPESLISKGLCDYATGALGQPVGERAGPQAPRKWDRARPSSPLKGRQLVEACRTKENPACDAGSRASIGSSELGPLLAARPMRDRTPVACA